jgi:hypothetical protein
MARWQNAQAADETQAGGWPAPGHGQAVKFSRVQK